MGRTLSSPNEKFKRNQITTYTEFEQYIRSFAEEKFNCLVIIGRPGVSKSEHIMNAIEGKKVLHLQGGQLTPIQFFIECYEHQNEPIILDDANEIMTTKIGKHLVMGITDTREEKTIEYKSSTKILESRETPTAFKTTSKFCYIANSWLSGSPESKALEDRAHLVWFNPSAKEVHKYTGRWFRDPEIFSYIGERLHLLDDHSCRTYVKALELKRAGFDWKAFLITEFYETNIRLVQELELDAGFKTADKKVKEFMRITKLSRATYFNYKKALKESNQLRPIVPEVEPELELQEVS